MNRYKKLKEKKQTEYKAWYHPRSDWWSQFSTNSIHSEVIKMSEEEALKKGYIRIYIYKSIINISSYNIPSDRVFSSVKYKLVENTYFSGIKRIIWDIVKNGKYITSYSFDTKTFLNIESINERI